MTKNSVKYPAVWSQDGGRTISNAVGNGGTGNPQYLIYPNKTYKKTSSLSGTGIQPHQCATHRISYVRLNQKPTVNYLNNGMLFISVPHEDVYQISTFSSAGRIINTFITRLFAGDNTVEITKGSNVSGMTLITITTAKDQVIGKNIVIK